MDDEDLDWLRRRLVAIDKAIHDAPPEDRELRYGLAQEGDRCRTMLRSGNAEAVATARLSWTERAAHKTIHEQNVPALKAIARNMGGAQGGHA